MTKIPCSTRKYIRGEFFPFVTFFLSVGPLNRSIEALVDTGSPFTVLGPRDVLTSRLPITKMKKGETVSLAGYQFFRHPFGKATLTFRTEVGEIFRVELDPLYILVPTRTDRLMMRNLEHIPSIIGNDFLRTHGLALCFKPSKEEAYLEVLS